MVATRDPASGLLVEIFCEPEGVDDPLGIHEMRPGPFDSWFAAMHAAATNWDGTYPIRQAQGQMGWRRAVVRPGNSHYGAALP